MGSVGIALQILNLALYGDGQPHPHGIASPWYSENRKLCGALSRSGRSGYQKNSYSCRDSNPDRPQPVA